MSGEAGVLDGFVREDSLLHVDRIILESKRDSLALKELVLDDAHDYFNLIDSDRAHHSQFGDITAVKYPTVESVRESIIGQNRNKKLRFGIWDNGTMVGSVNLTFNKGNKGETGSWVAKRYTGKNYATRARDVLVDFAFSEMGIGELVSEIAVGNKASQKSVERSGYKFKEERNGHWIYTLQKSDWLGRGSAS